MNLFTITVKNVWHRKTRTALTILGVGVSIAAFVTLIGLSDNLKKVLETTYETRGTDLIAMEKGTVDILSSRISEDYVQKIKQLPQISDVGPILAHFYAYKFKNYILIYGWDINSYLFDELIIDGKKLGDQNEALLGSLAAKRLDKKIGDKIKIKGKTFSVVGIFQSKSLLEDGAIILPLHKLQDIKRAENELTALNIKINTPSISRNVYETRDVYIEYVQSEIVRLFPDLEVKNIRNFVYTSTPISMVFNFIWAISIVAFIIVILGIANTMTTSVLERTREIGILLAIGWRKIKIIILILFEAMALGFWGGIVGVAIGCGIMKILVSTPQLQSIMTLSYNIDIILKAIFISLCLGFLSGLYPAFRAVSIEPIEVLRYGQ